MKNELKYARPLWEDFYIENLADFVGEHYDEGNHRKGCAIAELALRLDGLDALYQGTAYFVISRDETIDEAVQRYAPDIKAYMKQGLLEDFPWLAHDLGSAGAYTQGHQQKTAVPCKPRWNSRFKEIYAKRLERVEKEKKDNQSVTEDDEYPLPKWIDGKVLPMRLPSDRKDD